LFELSTYTASVSLLAFANPLAPFLSITSKSHVLPVLSVQRPFTQAEGWASGFVFAPQLGWRTSTLSYAGTQVQRRLLAMLAGDRGLVPALPVTVERPKGEMEFYCEPPKPRLSTLRNSVAVGLQLVGALY
jgi:hypothetical protein